MSGRAVDVARSRVVLVGTPAYRDSSLPDVPVVANNVADLADVLMELGGFAAEHCLTASPAASVEDIGDLLVQAASEAEDLLLFYYSGHGLLSPRGRELYLALANTKVDKLAFTALPFEAVRSVCLDSRAKSRVVILDSCFSGRAIGNTLADPGETVLGQLEVAGTYTLTSAPANRTALILPGEPHTAFTERLLRLLRTGSPEFGPMIGLGDIYRHLCIQLRSEGLPIPQQRGTETADLLGLVRNPWLLADREHDGADTAVVPIGGIVGILDGRARIQTSGYLPGDDDVIVSPAVVARYGVRAGDAIIGSIRRRDLTRKPHPLHQLTTVNGLDPDDAADRPRFERLTTVFPERRIVLGDREADFATRAIDLIAPLGFGQRALIVHPPGSDPTVLMTRLATAMTRNHPEAHLMLAMVGALPENVTLARSVVMGEIIATTFAESATERITSLELAAERAKRLAELGHDIVLIVDSLNSVHVACASSLSSGSAPSPTGGEDDALRRVRDLFGIGRDIQSGGSITLLGGLDCGPGAADEHGVYGALRPIATAEVRFVQPLLSAKDVPALDFRASATKMWHLLVNDAESADMARLRDALGRLAPDEANRRFQDLLTTTKTNTQSLASVALGVLDMD